MEKQAMQESNSSSLRDEFAIANMKVKDEKRNFSESKPLRDIVIRNKHQTFNEQW